MKSSNKKEITGKRGKYTFKRILKYVFILLFVLLILNVAPSFFYRAENNTNPLPTQYRKGVYHMHSVFSDGKGTVDEITRAAAELGLDFVILTDHGRPNIQSATSTSWLNQVLLIGGSELSLNCGHLAAMGFAVPDYIFPPEPQEAIDEIVNDNENGVCFVSHPFDDKVPWTDWDISRYTGLEILSSYTQARRAGILKILIFPLKYLVNSKYALLNTMSYPRLNIKKWDSVNESGKYYGIYALDAHAKLPISKKIRLNFPTYKSMFEIMTIYTKLGQSPGTDAQHAAATIIASLKKGNFFNVIEAIASANGFEAFFVETDSGEQIEMGGISRSARGKLSIHLPFDFKTDVLIIKDGTAILEKTGIEEKQVEFAIDTPGVYRIEVYVPGNRFDRLPWIMTNPFFLGVERNTSLPRLSAAKGEKEEEKGDRQKKPDQMKKTFPIALMDFKIEKNSRSQGTISEEVLEDNEKILRFTFNLEKESPVDKDFWSALAFRKPLNFSGNSGFVFEVRADKRLRAWLEFRTVNNGNETWLRHSFLADTTWRKVVIPVEKFHVYYGTKNAPNLANISALFFAINNAIAYPGAEGEIFLKNFRVY